MPSRFPARLVEDLWRIRCSTGWAHGSIWTHRRGFELRILWDGRPAWSSIHDDVRGAQLDGRAAKRRVERDGYDGLAPVDAAAEVRRKA